MNAHERRLKALEDIRPEHEGMVRILDMYAMSVIYRNRKNGTVNPVPCRWVPENSHEAKEYLRKIEAYRRRRAKK